MSPFASRSGFRILFVLTVVALSVVPAGFPASAVARQASTDYLLIGDARAAALDNEGAIEAYEAAWAPLGEAAPFDLQAKLTRVYVDRGMDLAFVKDKEKAEPAFARGLELAESLRERYPERSETWLLLALANGGIAQFRSGREKVRAGWAIESYCQESIRLDPSSALPYAALGKFYREVAGLGWLLRTIARALYGRLPSGTYEQSEAMLRKAVELDPDLSIAHFELGATLFRLDRHDEAEAEWKRALELPVMTTRDVRHNDEIRAHFEGR